MGLASFNRMRLRRNEAMLPENIAKAKEEAVKKPEIVESVKEPEVAPVEEAPVKEEVKRGSKRK